MVVQSMIAARCICQAWPADQERHAASELVSSLVITPYIEFALVFAVVSAYYDNGILQNIQIRQGIE